MTIKANGSDLSYKMTWSLNHHLFNEQINLYEVCLIQNDFPSNAIIEMNKELVLSDKMLMDIALKQFELIKQKMLGSLASKTNKEALNLLGKYEAQLNVYFNKMINSLSENNYFSTYCQRILDPAVLEGIQQLQQEHTQLQAHIEKIFDDHISFINQDFPDQIEAYLTETIAQNNTTLHIKQQAFNSQAAAYLEKVELLDKFLSEYTSIIPEYSIYGNIVEKVETCKNEMHALQKQLLKKIQLLCEPGKLNDQIRQKINHTINKIEANKKEALGGLKQKFSSCNLDQAYKASEYLQGMARIYLENLNIYLSLAGASVNQLVSEVLESITQTIRLQDEQMLQLMKQAESVIDFLEYETNKIIQIAQASEKPLISKEVGKKNGVSFDECGCIAHGRISKISLKSGWRIDSMQITYEDRNGEKYQSGAHGGEGGNSHEILLSLNERITSAYIGTGAFTKDFGSQGIDELTFHVFDAETKKRTSKGPYGGRGGHWEMQNGKNLGMEWETINPGPDYYLGAIKGSENAYITSLALVFFKDFSPILKLDLSQKLAATIQLLKESPQLKLSDEEQQKIHEVFFGAVYVDLKGDQNDPYAVLGLKPGAEKNEVNAAYHKLALKYHTDKIRQDEIYKLPLYEAKFKQIESAHKKILEKLAGNSESSPYQPMTNFKELQ